MPAEKVLREASGIENYNFKLMTLNEKDGKVIHCEFGIVNSDGEKVYCLDDMGTGVEVLTKITEDQAAELGGWMGGIYYLGLVHSETQLTVFPLFRRGPWRPHISPPGSLHHPARGSGQTALDNWGPGYGEVYNCSTVGQRER